MQAGKISEINQRAGCNKAVQVGMIQKINNLCCTFLLIFGKNTACTALLHPARLLIFGYFAACIVFSLLILEKLHPARPYYILHVY